MFSLSLSLWIIGWPSTLRNELYRDCWRKCQLEKGDEIERRGRKKRKKERRERKKRKEEDKGGVLSLKTSRENL